MSSSFNDVLIYEGGIAGGASVPVAPAPAELGGMKSGR